MKRQVRVRGAVTPIPAEEADAYFQSRDRGARLGAWASQQSRPLPDRLALEKRVAEFALKFGVGAVPRPPYWGGWLLAPVQMEFWRDRPFRLHDRLVFTRPAPGAPWASAGRSAAAHNALTRLMTTRRLVVDTPHSSPLVPARRDGAFLGVAS